MTAVAQPSRFDAIDLASLAAPEVVEPLDFEAIRAALIADFQARWEAVRAAHPDADLPPYDVGMLETDPVVVLCEAAAWRELLLRARVNDAARNVMLAFAAGRDLDHLAALYATARHEDESDAAFRARVQLAPEALSTAGPIGAYVFHALAAHPHVRDAGVHSPSPGEVHVLPLVREGDGLPDEDVLDAVRARLADTAVRPLTDAVTVRPPARIDFIVDATLRVPHGPAGATVIAAATAALQAYLGARHKVGRPVYRSGILAALTVPPVETVILASPVADVLVAPDEVAWAAEITIVAEAAS